MMALERQSPPASHWSREQYDRIFAPGAQAGPNYIAIVIETEAPPLASGVVGFAVARHLGPEWELENLVVALASRRQGLGKQLLEHLIATAQAAGAEKMFLEVRESNDAARALYQTLGFTETGRRKAYYTGPPEDAILYRRDLR